MSSPALHSFHITAYATLNAFKVVAVEAASGQEAVVAARALLAQDTDLQDGWTAMSELTLTSTIDWDIDQAHCKVLARPTALLDDATAPALVAMLSEASDNHAARLDDLQPRDALAEVADWDRVVAFLRGNGIKPVDLRFIVANLADAEQRARLQARVAELDEAERDDASRAMGAFDLDDQAWDALPEAARLALIAATGGTDASDMKAKADAYDRTVAAAKAYDEKLNAEEKAPEGDDYAELFDLIVPVKS
ncbi:hypothetical protein BAMBUS_00120 [Brevundimonas phage vB_BpoS-Bambus]|nr:hypothetical protein BAMBUS_00120 [Brevundimonas phage vB_BpoS-Bambus]